MPSSEGQPDGFATVPEAVDAVSRGEIVVVVDD